MPGSVQIDRIDVQAPAHATRLRQSISHIDQLGEQAMQRLAGAGDLDALTIIIELLEDKDMLLSTAAGTAMKPCRPENGNCF